MVVCGKGAGDEDAVPRRRALVATLVVAAARPPLSTDPAPSLRPRGTGWWVPVGSGGPLPPPGSPLLCSIAARAAPAAPLAAPPAAARRRHHVWRPREAALELAPCRGAAPRARRGRPGDGQPRAGKGRGRRARLEKGSDVGRRGQGGAPGRPALSAGGGAFATAPPWTGPPTRRRSKGGRPRGASLRRLLPVAP